MFDHDSSGDSIGLDQGGANMSYEIEHLIPMAHRQQARWMH